MRTQAPLAGMRVLEFGHIAAGPFAGLLLADLGADVVKIEPPDGDGLRSWPPLVERTDGGRFSLNFAALNRNKRSVVADLKDPEANARVAALCARADVVVENYRPGVLARLGFGFDAVAARNECVVYCSVSGYGVDGPYAGRGAFDLVVQAMSGLMSVTGEADGPAAKCGVPVGDFVAGLYAAYSILAAHAVAQRERRAIHLDCPMVDCLLGISGLQWSEYWGTGVPPKRLGSAHPRNAPYQAFEARDRPFVIAAGNDALWRAVCDATGQDALLDDPRFSGIVERANHQQELAAILAPVFARRTAEEWIDDLSRRGVPCGPVKDFGEILADESLTARGLIQPLEIPAAAPTKAVVYPVGFDGARPGIRRPPPLLGEHTAEVFAEWTEPARL